MPRETVETVVDTARLAPRWEGATVVGGGEKTVLLERINSRGATNRRRVRREVVKIHTVDDESLEGAMFENGGYWERVLNG